MPAELKGGDNWLQKPKNSSKQSLSFSIKFLRDQRLQGKIEENVKIIIIIVGN